MSPHKQGQNVPNVSDQAGLDQERREKLHAPAAMIAIVLSLFVCTSAGGRQVAFFFFFFFNVPFISSHFISLSALPQATQTRRERFVRGKGSPLDL